MFQYPYGDTQQLNLDWLMEQWQETKASIDGSLQGEIDRVEAAITDLLTARDQAVAAKTAAETAATSAAGYAGTASAAASTATAQATAAASSAALAGTHASNAQTSETNAGLQATAAGNSASAAAVSEGNARNSELAAAASSSAAAGNALYAEGMAKGTQNGTPVTSGSPYYEDNAKYYADQAAQEASDAADSAQDAQDVLDSIPADYSALSAEVNGIINAYTPYSGMPLIKKLIPYNYQFAISGAGVTITIKDNKIIAYGGAGTSYYQFVVTNQTAHAWQGTSSSIINNLTDNDFIDTPSFLYRSPYGAKYAMDCIAAYFSDFSNQSTIGLYLRIYGKKADDSIVLLYTINWSEASPVVARTFIDDTASTFIDYPKMAIVCTSQARGAGKTCQVDLSLQIRGTGI